MSSCVLDFGRTFVVTGQRDSRRYWATRMPVAKVHLYNYMKQRKKKLKKKIINNVIKIKKIMYNNIHLTKRRD